MRLAELGFFKKLLGVDFLVGFWEILWFCGVFESDPLEVCLGTAFELNLMGLVLLIGVIF